MIDSGRYFTPMPSTQEATEQNRSILVQALHQEYRRRLGAVGLHAHTDMLCPSLSLIVRRSATVGGGEGHLAPCVPMIQAYDEAGQRLLILGEPGAGKTTLLLELACELLTRAEDDLTLPIPIVLNLSSWASQKPSLERWLIEQLQLVYMIPSRLSQAWLGQDRWLLLLDGIDEVEEPLRLACSEAINLYIEEHLTPLVVCSCSDGYRDQESPLLFSNAVVVQPLQEQQVTAYLEQLGESVTSIRDVMHKNPVLRQLITTPLMLRLIILAYRDKTAEDLSQLGSSEELQRQIFKRYTERMLEQRTTRGQFTPQQTRSWLIWLAQHMKQRHLTEFYLAYLQPTWLTTNRSYIEYRLFYMLIYGLVGGVLYGLAGWVVYSLLGEQVYGLVLGFVLGLVLGLVAGLLDDIQRIWPAEVLRWSWKAMRRELVAELDDIQKIRPVEVLRWSWNSLWQGLFIGLLVGLISWLIMGLIGALIAGLIGALLAGLVIGLLGELMAKLVTGLIRGGIAAISDEVMSKDMHARPNQHIHNSGWNALRSGLIGGLVGGLAVGLIAGLIVGVMYGLVFGFFCGFFLGGVVAQFSGGRAYICHYVLRYVFSRRRTMPWHYVRFLEEATELKLLQGVGGGYRFIHPLFLDYVASQGTDGAFNECGQQRLEPFLQR